MRPCGVLALQGDWEAHCAALAQLGAEVEHVRSARQLERVGGLVIPGGESTAILRLMATERLAERIGDRVRGGMPLLVTCAGLILAAVAVVPEQPSLGLVDVDVVRNAYGRQVSSAVVPVELVPELGEPSRAPGVFIRAPRVTRVGDQVEVLGRREGDPVLLRQGAIVAATYHPELARDRRVHRLFLSMVERGDG